MNIFEALRVAFAGLLANRLRSSLTMLGILIGVAAVILLVAVGNGASVQINNQIQSLGANVIFVYPSNARGAGGVSQGFGTGQTLTMADVDAINSRQQDPDIVAAIPIAQSGGQITYANQNYFAPTTGTTVDFPQVRDYQIAEGSFFTQDVTNTSCEVKVTFGSTVTIQKQVLGSTGDLQDNQTVTITGTRQADGSILAQSIQIGPAGGGVRPGTGGGTTGTSNGGGG